MGVTHHHTSRQYNREYNKVHCGEYICIYTYMCVCVHTCQSVNYADVKSQSSQVANLSHSRIHLIKHQANESSAQKNKCALINHGDSIKNNTPHHLCEYQPDILCIRSAGVLCSFRTDTNRSASNRIERSGIHIPYYICISFN